MREEKKKDLCPLQHNVIFLTQQVTAHILCSFHDFYLNFTQS